MTLQSDTLRDRAFRRYQRARQSHWDQVALSFEGRRTWGSYYHKRLAQIYRHTIAPGQRILEIGCGKGDLLAALMPSFGLGLDFSFEMVKRAREKYPNLSFVQSDAHKLSFDHQFDVVILSDLLNDVWDVQAVLQEIQQNITPRTKLIINSYSR